MAGTRPTGACLKCDKQLKTDFQYYLNQISGPLRRNPIIPPSDVKRITKAVCTCSTVTHREWLNVFQDKKNFIEAHRIYVESEEFKSNNPSVHGEFYKKRLQPCLVGNGSSADRLIYLLAEKIKKREGPQSTDILDEIVPKGVRNPGHTRDIGTLRKEHVGRFLGKGGSGIKEAVHGISVKEITIDFQDAPYGMVKAKATFRCRKRLIDQVKQKLIERIEYFKDEEPIPIRQRPHCLFMRRQGGGGRFDEDMEH